MNRIPLRLRLTLVFALAMAVVLAGVGLFLYVRLGDALISSVDESLVERATVLAAMRDGGTVLEGDDDAFAQVLGRDGDVVAATPGFEAPLLSADQRASASGDQLFIEKEIAPRGEAEDEPTRLLAVAVESELLVVGASIEDQEDALDGLLAQLSIGVPVGLLFASAAGYLLAGAALAPVEAMRRRAAEISAETSGDRLPLPRARDEIRRLGSTINAMLDRLDEGIRRERRFVADASHELRTPLALVRTELELALRRPRSKEQLERALASASDEVDRLARLAEDLLVLASSEEATVPLQRSRFAVDEFLDGIARRFDERAAVAGRAVGVGATLDREIDADRLRLEQAIGNLVDNAIRHGSGEIRIDALEEGGSIVFRVCDQGSGFEPGFVSRAFERFSRGDAARTEPGAGLGLAIVDAIARAHGGEASARNRSDGGSEVEIAIPA